MTRELRWQRLILGCSFLMLGSSCALRGSLVPLKGDSSLAKVKTSSNGESTSVDVEVKPNAWSGVPSNLTKVTPLLIKIDNQHSESIRLRYNEFILRAKDGRQFHALPPFDIKGSQVDRLNYNFPVSGFVIAPYQWRFFPAFPRVRGGFALDGIYYGAYHPAMNRLRLPTSDMIVKALPEGVLEPQGKITGFLYFENVDRDLEEIDFVAQIVSAESKATVGEIRIPFKVQ